MLSRRHLLIAAGISALTCGSRLPRAEAQEVPPGGTASIIDDGIVQFDYVDGTRIRVYDDKIVIMKPGQPDQEKPRFQIDAQAVAMPPILNEPVLNKWLNTHADDLRKTIRSLLRNDGNSNDKYDHYERDLSLTVYKKILVRHKYIRRLTRTE